MSRLLQVFFNSDLRCSHDGLSQLAKEHDINVSALEPGEYVIFVNSAKNRLKLYASNNVLAYLKLDSGKGIDLRTIALIPKAFKASGKLDYDQALKEVLTKELKLE